MFFTAVFNNTAALLKFNRRTKFKTIISKKFRENRNYYFRILPGMKSPESPGLNDIF